MEKNYTEKIQKTPLFILRTGMLADGRIDFMNMTMNTPENKHLHIKMIGYEECAFTKEERIHTFESSTLHFILSGKGYFDSMPLEQGDGFMVKKNHIAKYEPDKHEPWIYCWINFDGDIADDLLATAGFSEDKCTFSMKENKKILELILASLQYDYTKTDVGMHLNSVLLEIFALLIADKPTLFTNASDSVMEERVRSGIDFINTHYKEKNCIDLLAREENVNKRYLSRLFRQFSDRSPQGHLMRIRIEEAKKLLRTTGLSVSEIGACVGYEDVMQFSKIFHKHTGVSPTAYREGTMDEIREYE